MKSNLLHIAAVIILVFCQVPAFAVKIDFPILHSSNSADSVIGTFTEVTPSDSVFVTGPDEDFWVITTAAADVDNDGDLDIAVLGYYVVYNVSVEDRLILMKNNGPAGPSSWNFYYQYIPLGTLSTGASSLAWGDADGDGDLDLALGTDMQTVLFRNDAGTLALTNTVLPGYYEENSQAYFDLRSITWADPDNDGDQDLLIPSVPDTSGFGYLTSFMRNDGPNGSGGRIFTRFDSVFPSTMHAQSIWADEDGDGDQDLLLANQAPLMDDGFIRIFRNDSNLVFTQDAVLGTLSIEHGEAQWGDYDGDGDLDILVAGNLKETNGTYTPMALRIYQNIDGNYIASEVIPDPFGAGWFDFTAATWADYDSDGDMDILLAGHYNSGSEIEGRARVYINNGGTFTDSGIQLPAPHASGDRGGAFTWLDLDNDGDLDYFIAGEYFVPGGNGLVEAQMHLYRNDPTGQNTAPVAPGSISVTQLGAGSVKVAWLPGSDDHTPAGQLTYNLQLFRDNLPASLPLSLPEPGNMSSETSWTFNGLETGSYHWMLTTLDASYSAGTSVTGSFELFPLSTESPRDESLTLEALVPNPANHSTNIRFRQSIAGDVSVRIADEQGKILLTPFTGFMEAGSQSVPVDVSKLPAGPYICILTSRILSLTGKLVVTH